MTTEDLFAGASAVELRDEKARRAVKAFRAMQPGLTGYARALTRKRNVSVELSEGTPRTDGKKIYIKPPIALGDPTAHERRLCDKRDSETLKLLCPACAIREEVLIVVYHEIDHLAYGSFDEPDQAALQNMIEFGINEYGSKYASEITNRIKKAPSYKINTYLKLASLVSEFLPIIVNSLEDARVDNEMFKARPGTRVMFDALVFDIFKTGVEQPDGTKMMWSEYPLNSQAMIGVFILACKYNFDGWFHTSVEQALKDKKLGEIVNRINFARSSLSSYQLAFPVLARLRELGFCKLDTDPEEEDDSQAEMDGESSDSDSSEDVQESREESPGNSQGDSGSRTEDSQSEGGEVGSDTGSQSGSSEGLSGPDSMSQSDEPVNNDNKEADGEPDSDSDGSGRDQEDLDGEESDYQEGGEVNDDDDDSEGSDNEEAGQADSDVHSGGEQGVCDGDSPKENRASDGNSDRLGDEFNGESDQVEGDGTEREDSSISTETEVIDSGADDGQGGVESAAPEMGSPEQAGTDVQVFSKHDVAIGERFEESEEDERALNRAIIQNLYFESSSINVHGVEVIRYGKSSGEDAWTNGDQLDAYDRERSGIDFDVTVNESVLGPALLATRKTFSDNAREAQEHNLRSGKINTRMLGKRASVGDDRLFKKKRMPGKRSYSVVIGIDISGSTQGVNIGLAKRAATAQAELCSRVGVDFAVYAHSTGSQGYREPDAVHGYSIDLQIYEIKNFSDPWSNDQRNALSKIGSWMGNLDGHSIEYYRKTVEATQTTDKIILYYSDGKMPAANHDEELEILQREIRYCKSQSITLMGVGIRTDSPSRHGLDTVQVDDDSDLVKVVQHLEKVLLRSAR